MGSEAEVSSGNGDDSSTARGRFEGSANSRAWGWLDTSLAALVWVLAAGVIWLPVLPPAADFPNHLLAVIVHVWPERFAGLLEPNLPLTALGFVGPMLALVPQLEPILAARVLLSVFGVGFAVSAAIIARRFGHHVPLAIAGSALLLVGWPWAMGFWNYVAALAIALTASAIWVTQPPRWMSRGGVAGLLVVAAMAHAPGAIIGACWTLWLLLSIRSRRDWFADALVLLAPLTVLVLPIVFRSLYPVQELALFARPSWVWTPWTERIGQISGLSVDGYSPLAGWVCTVAWVLLLVRLFRSARPRDEAHRSSMVAMGGVVIGVAVFLCLPLHVPGWAFLSPRVLPPLLVAGLVHAPRAQHAIDRVFATLLLAALAASMSLSLRNASDAGDYTARVLGQLPSTSPGSVYSAVVGTESPGYHPAHVRVAVGLASYVSAAGGAWPGAFALDPDIHFMRFPRPVAELFPATNPWREWSTECVMDPQCARPLLWADAIAIEALAWDTAFVGGATPEMRQRLIERGYVSETNTVWHPRPANVRLDVFEGPGTPTAHSLVVEVYWPNTLDRIWSTAVPGSARRARTIYPVAARLPAGPALLVSCEDTSGDLRCSADDRGLRTEAMSLQGGTEHIVPCGPGAPSAGATTPTGP
ncbi:MAG: hypothetical protein KGO50_03020 [Myxococcales bacterium]|nr:hypothetical protein [Myxococcales bacterium]